MILSLTKDPDMLSQSAELNGKPAGDFFEFLFSPNFMRAKVSTPLQTALASGLANTPSIAMFPLALNKVYLSFIELIMFLQ